MSAFTGGAGVFGCVLDSGGGDEELGLGRPVDAVQVRLLFFAGTHFLLQQSSHRRRQKRFRHNRVRRGESKSRLRLYHDSRFYLQVYKTPTWQGQTH